MTLLGIKTAVAALLVGVALTGCPHKVPVEQGNIVTPEMLGNVATGMTQSEVREVLGTPLMVSPFEDGFWIYYYNRDTRASEPKERKLVLKFEGDVLATIDSSGQFDKEWPGDKRAN